MGPKEKCKGQPRLLSKLTLSKVLLNKLNYIERDTNQWTSGTIKAKQEP